MAIMSISNREREPNKKSTEHSLQMDNAERYECVLRVPVEARDTLTHSIVHNAAFRCVQLCLHVALNVFLTANGRKPYLTTIGPSPAKKKWTGIATKTTNTVQAHDAPPRRQPSDGPLRITLATVVTKTSRALIAAAPGMEPC